MTDQFDETRDRMIRALMGELPDDEYSDLIARIESDEDLLRDWRELGEARQFIAGIHADASESPVAFSVPPATDAKEEFSRMRSRFLRSIGLAGAGFVAASLLFCVLLVAGFRIDRTPQGMLVSFSRHTEIPDANQALAAQLTTRGELEEALLAVLDVTRARFDELERTQDQQQAYYSKLLYQALAENQQRQFQDLRTRIELAALTEAYQPPRFNPTQGD